MTDAAEIDEYLLGAGGWVPAAEICARFQVNERALRGLGERPGLCSAFAISGDKGFKHIRHATPGEWERFSSRLKQHAISELVRIKRLRLKRAAFLVQRPPVTFEKNSGQAVLVL